jgi:hypothetical protein
MTDLSSRVTSAYPLSLPTSLAMESIFPPANPQDTFDPSRMIPQQIDITQYQILYVNTDTLFRNMMSSVERPMIPFLKPADVANEIIAEMDIIDGLLLNEGGGACRAVYYQCTYRSIKSDLVKIRQDRTDGQRVVSQLLKDTTKVLIASGRVMDLNMDIRPERRCTALIITHHPLDLINYTSFNRLDLLESHTGVLKPRYMWYTKYYPVGDLDLSRIPFHRKMLYIFGDRVQITPYDIAIRRRIAEISIKRQWTPMSTIDKVMLDLSLEIKEPYVIKYIRDL